MGVQLQQPPLTLPSPSCPLLCFCFLQAFVQTQYTQPVFTIVNQKRPAPEAPPACLHLWQTFGMLTLARTLQGEALLGTFHGSWPWKPVPLAPQENTLLQKDKIPGINQQLVFLPLCLWIAVPFILTPVYIVDYWEVYKWKRFSVQCIWSTKPVTFPGSTS